MNPVLSALPCSRDSHIWVYQATSGLDLKLPSTLSVITRDGRSAAVSTAGPQPQEGSQLQARTTTGSRLHRFNETPRCEQFSPVWMIFLHLKCTQHALPRVAVSFPQVLVSTSSHRMRHASCKNGRKENQVVHTWGPARQQLEHCEMTPAHWPVHGASALVAFCAEQSECRPDHTGTTPSNNQEEC